MATKPTSIPRWADVGGDIVEPNSAKKDVGWVSAERPPAQYFNWLLNLTYQWIAFIDQQFEDSYEKIIPAFDGFLIGNDDPTPTGPDYLLLNLTGGGQLWAIPLRMTVGDRIKNVRVHVQDNLAGPVVVTAKVFRSVSNSGAAQSELATVASDGSGNFQELTMTAINETVIDNRYYWVRIDSSTTGNIGLKSVEVDYDRP